MFPSSNHDRCDLKTAITVAVFICIVSLYSKPVGSMFSGHKERESMWMRKMMVLGSRPPGCKNKCFNCRPCLATVVIHQSHQLSIKGFRPSSPSSSSSLHGEDDGYYLLSWKCRCGDKIFEP